MPNSERTIVVGGGFSGLVAAYLLAKEMREVTLISKTRLGGIAGGILWRDFSLDLGCHIFGNSQDRATEVLLALMDNQVLPVDMCFASRFGGKTLEGFELPDLSAKADSAKMIIEIARAASQRHAAPRNLEELLVQRFGPTAAEVAACAFSKTYRTTADKVAPEAIAATCFKRIRVVEDQVASILKQSPALERVIAAGSQEDPMKYYKECEGAPYRAFYPAADGMLGFVRNARRVLESMGVNFVVAEAVESVHLDDEIVVRGATTEFVADSCVWTAGLEAFERSLSSRQTLAGTSYGVPMALYYFDIDAAQAGPYSYVNSFDAEDLVFRCSLPGSYGQGSNCPPGRGYVCCEVPTDTDAEVFVQPEAFAARVWEEACAFGAVQGTYDHVRVFTTPVSYKVPMAHYHSVAAPIREQVAGFKNLVVADEWAFTKNRIITDLERCIGALNPLRRAA
ncbi:MAG: NAD(P)-binding protein [Myxococcales bacterium]|nr:NAD(P)-binding protein [Myxococcales bacterium]